LILLAEVGGAADVFPRIANGVFSQDYPAVGLLHLSSPSSGGTCSGTMIGCDTFLTAAHCVCETDADTAEECRTGGIIAPENMTVFLQHAGLQAVRSIEIHNEYDFGVGADIAILKLATPVTGIAPLPINRVAQPKLGSAATLVGFGTTGLDSNVGIKRMGKVVVAACTSEHPADRNVCWSFREPQGPPGSNSDTCEGDSGGPLLARLDGQDVVAGITSGGSSFTCLPPDDSFDTDVYFYRAFIAAIAGSDIDSQRCSDLPQVGEEGVVERDDSDTIASAEERRYSITVPAATRLLRVTLNGDSGLSRRSNDFDLYVRRQENPTSDLFDCGSSTDTTYEHCEVSGPQPGVWNILVQSFRGQGAFQLTTTIFAGCHGDCDADGVTGAVDLQQAIRVSLEQEGVAVCGAADASADDEVSIDELVLAVTASRSCGPGER